MLIFITTHGHTYTAGSLVERTYGAEAPECQVFTYERFFYADHVPRARYIFTDIERLYAWELPLAADLYRSLRQAGMPCLNDPARVMTRYELLRTLHRRGVNPFTVYRADDSPRPNRFPVFVRREADHGVPLSDLLPDQPALEAGLAALREGGMPLRGLIVVEYASEPIAPNVWRKFGTYRAGDAVFVDHCVVEDRWVVKNGVQGLATDPMFEEERAAVMSNRYAQALKPAFELAAIEWGRADHATYEGREIVYEINTNPDLGALSPQRSPIRDESLLFARERMARQLWRLDFGDGTMAALNTGERLAEFRRRNPEPSSPAIRV